MKGYEFFSLDDELWCCDNGRNIKVDVSNEGLINKLLEKIRCNYPTAYEYLTEHYKYASPNMQYYRFLIVRRFVKCNFSNLDTTDADIENKGVMHFEHVACPLRGECECEGVVCCPKYKTSLSQREEEIGKLWYGGLSRAYIAKKLCISQDTVVSHIRNIYSKLGVHSIGEFVACVNTNNIFK